MAKTITYRVVNNRLLFKCPSCSSRRMLSLPADIHRKSIRCHKCGEIAHCFLNRRQMPRESQAGKAVLVFSDGRELNIELYDISAGGVGFDVQNGSRGVSVSQEVRLKCAWNPRLLDQCRYVVRNVNGRRVGVQSIDRNFM
jgi:DNA-directed RNA polymerase subunit RPC12/RpoP